MVLCAGYGKRLLPLTRSRAKPAIPFLNKPFINHVLEKLSDAGIKDIVANLHHLPDTVRALTQSFPPGMDVHFVEEEGQILGTAGGLKNAQKFLKHETFLLINSDIFFTIDLTKALRFHRDVGSAATMVLMRNPDIKAFSPVFIDAGQRLIQLAGRPEIVRPDPDSPPLLFTGIHILQSEIFDYIPEDTPFEIAIQVYPQMIQENRPVYGYVTEDFWCEAGTLSRYISSTAAALDTLGLEGLVASGADLSAGAQVDASSVIGPGCRVGSGAEISSSILLGQVTIGAEAVVENAILDEGVVIQNGQRVRNQCLSLAPGTGELICVETG
ncbi:sugar phosphate nucleotidyltransferase [Acidobacteriota bacterium]